jgi:hypothetical protein
MSHLDYLIKNCSAKDFESACPKHWDKLKPAFSDMVRHCDHCSKKVYLCETDEQIKFYTSVKFCIAVAQPEGLLNVEGNTPSNLASVSHTVESTAQHGDEIMGNSIPFVPKVWRRPPSPVLHEVVQHDERVSSSHMKRVTDDSDIPAFLRKRSK